MSVFMVERDLKGITMDQLAAAQRRAIDTSAEFSSKGKPVRYIRSTFVPAKSVRCACSRRPIPISCANSTMRRTFPMYGSSKRSI